MLIKINERPNTTNMIAKVAMKEFILTVFELKRYMITICSDKPKCHYDTQPNHSISSQKTIKQRSKNYQPATTIRQRQKDFKKSELQSLNDIVLCKDVQIT